MLQEKTKITVIGAGAIGGVTAALLAKAGWDVEIVCKHQEIADRCTNPGLRVTGIRGEFVVPVRGVKQISDLSGPLDTVLLATKATDCIPAAKELLPKLAEDSCVLSLQNGICEEALAEVLGRNRVIGCVVVWGASRGGCKTSYTFYDNHDACQLNESVVHEVLVLVSDDYASKVS
ncbi:MAG: hypothetical protein HY912_11695, partial [Desulfomonile tiedjei]|nr:hypothetical protein [Desulfomonile tiedjei]